MENDIRCRYASLARKHGLNPVWLREIIDLRVQGLNYSQIEKIIGIARETVARYINAMGKLDTRERWLLIIGAGLVINDPKILGYWLD